MAEEEQSYIDYDTFLDPKFSPTSFANTLVTSTNNASDTPIDLSTPLSRVLFDQQEIDTHIHTLTTKSALPLLSHTQSQSAASQKILTELEQQISALTEGYKQLETEVIQRHATAEEVRLTVSRLWVTVKIGRGVGRALLLGRQLDTQMVDVNKTATGGKGKEDHRSMIRAAHSILALRSLLAASGPGEEGEHLSRINVVNTLRTDILAPSEQKLRTKAQQVIREFSLSSLTAPVTDTPSRSSTPQPGAQSQQQQQQQQQTQTFAQTAETKSRTTSACIALYLLSAPAATAAAAAAAGNARSTSTPSQTPTLLISALQTYLQAALTASLASLARALAQLPNLPRALSEVSARCQNVSGLETLLATIATPSLGPDAAAPTTTATTNTNKTNGDGVGSEAEAETATLLIPLLRALDTHSLPSYFWRTLASGLGGRVAEILGRGGVGARNLRAQRERVRESFREAVLKGCEGAAIRDEEGRVVKVGRKGGEWEREVIVVVGSVVGSLGR